MLTQAAIIRVIATIGLQAIALRAVASLSEHQSPRAASGPSLGHGSGPPWPRRASAERTTPPAGQGSPGEGAPVVRTGRQPKPIAVARARTHTRTQTRPQTPTVASFPVDPAAAGPHGSGAVSPAAPGALLHSERGRGRPPTHRGDPPPPELPLYNRLAPAACLYLPGGDLRPR